MKIIKQYTAIQLNNEIINDNVDIRLSYGEVTYDYGYRNTPETIFATEDDAIEYAFKTNKWGRWLILPVIEFDNY